MTTPLSSAPSPAPLRRGLANLLGDALDLFIAPAYSAPGFAVRSAGFDPAALDVDLRGRHFIVTGANAGLGLALAGGLARRGATVHLLCRDLGRGEAARQGLIAAGASADQLLLHQVDVSSRASVRRFAAAYLATERPIHGLIHNAGVLPPERVLVPREPGEPEDDVELTFATNVLGPYLLTRLLAPRLRASAPARVVFVSSGGMYSQRLDLDDLQSARPQPFDGVVAYAQTKRAEIHLTEHFAAALADGVTVNAMHPGWADTPGVRTSLPRFHRLTRLFLRDAEAGADTALWLAISPEAAPYTGLFFFDRKPRRTHLPLMRTEGPADTTQRLIAACEHLAPVA